MLLPYAAVFEEEGLYRPSTGQFRLHVQDPHHLTGTFVSTAAKARGPSHWVRASSRLVAPAPMSPPRDTHVARRSDDRDATQAPVPARSRTAPQSRPTLHLGMSQAEVRQLLGEPVSVEAAPTFVFWHYGSEKEVVFEQGTGRVHGWLGFSP